MKWSVSPPISKGLLLDIDEGVIEGVPLACAPMVRYTVTARNSSGESQGVLPLEVQALVNQTRRTTIASDAASASYVTSYRCHFCSSPNLPVHSPWGRLPTS
ncbi:hypothetical protein T484DRAFT_3021973 [Baffinella frigidus]|nr:hypothetical protein T484DRAFT_3021973 [Cryptophyta sp. CCMP2293]